MRGRLRGRASLAAVAFVVVAAAAHAVPLEPSRIEDVEAAYIVNFIRYSVWPSEALPSADAPYVITVIGDDAVLAALEALAPRAAGSLGRPIEVRSLKLPSPRSGESIPVEAIGRTHVIFVGRLAQRWMRDLLADLEDTQVLTIGAASGFAAAGGMLGLVREGDRVVFEANAAAVRRSGVVVSARVLALARRVDG
jgi:hypothetical protein